MTPAALSVRELTAADAPAEAARTAHSCAARLGADAGGSFTLGAFEGERLVGAVTGDHDPRAKVCHIGHVTGMMVHGDVQGRGVGRLLIERLMERATAGEELYQLARNASAGNDVALRLNGRAEFVHDGTLPRALRVGGRFLDKRHMPLKLR